MLKFGFKLTDLRSLKVKEDPDFNAADESAVSAWSSEDARYRGLFLEPGLEATHTIELKKRPSGIKRYTHGVDGKGAMVMDMHEKALKTSDAQWLEARYPGDPQGQAAVAGVKKGFVVKSVNGTDVRSRGPFLKLTAFIWGWDFEDIMDLLEEHRSNIFNYAEGRNIL